MLSKYNLYVGGVYNSKWTAYGDEATGIQNSAMLGWISGDVIRSGTTIFSTINYWNNGSVLNEKYGNSYPAYVYDNNSSIYTYVENYKIYLEKQGALVENARLIKLEELETLGCSIEDRSCASAPSWVYSTSYWTGEADLGDYIWFVIHRQNLSYDSYTYGVNYGVRPIIELSKINL